MYSCIHWNLTIEIIAFGNGESFFSIFFFFCDWRFTSATTTDVADQEGRVFVCSGHISDFVCGKYDDVLGRFRG